MPAVESPARFRGARLPGKALPAGTPLSPKVVVDVISPEAKALLRILDGLVEKISSTSDAQPPVTTSMWASATVGANQRTIRDLSLACGGAGLLAVLLQAATSGLLPSKLNVVKHVVTQFCDQIDDLGRIWQAAKGKLERAVRGPAPTATPSGGRRRGRGAALSLSLEEEPSERPVGPQLDPEGALLHHISSRLGLQHARLVLQLEEFQEEVAVRAQEHGGPLGGEEEVVGVVAALHSLDGVESLFGRVVLSPGTPRTPLALAALPSPASSAAMSAASPERRKGGPGLQAFGSEELVAPPAQVGEDGAVMGGAGVVGYDTEESLSRKMQGLGVKYPPGPGDLRNEIPESFLCPLTGRVMRDPVILKATGVTYEDRALRKWLWVDGHMVCPRSRVALEEDKIRLVPDHALKGCIDAWVERRPQERELLRERGGGRDGDVGAASLAKRSGAEGGGAPEYRAPKAADQLGNLPRGIAQRILNAVELLQSTSPEARRCGVCDLEVLAEDPKYKSAVVRAGAVPPLCRVLRRDADPVRGRAAVVVRLLAYVAAKELKDEGAIDSLVDILCRSNPIGQFTAAMALKTMDWDFQGSGREGRTPSGAVLSLVAMLSSGNSSTQEIAAGTLGMLAQQNGVARREIVTAGGPIILARLLRWGKPDMWLAAGSALYKLATGRTAEIALVRRGCLDMLVRVLEESHDVPKEWAVRVISRLSPDVVAAGEVCSAGAIPLLVHMLGEGQPEGHRTHAGIALSKVAEFTLYREVLTDAGIVEPLCQLARESRSREALDAVQRALQKCATSAQVKREVVKHSWGLAPEVLLDILYNGPAENMADAMTGVVQPLVEVLMGGVQAEDDPRRSEAIVTAARALARLGEGDEDSLLAMVRAGGVPALVDMTGQQYEPRVRVSAVRAVRTLAGHEVGRTAVLEAGGLTRLISLLSDQSTEAQETCAATVGMIAASEPGCQAQFRRDGAIAALGRLLQSAHPGVVGAAAGALNVFTKAAGDEKLGVADESRSAIQVLVEILESDDPRGYEAAARGLINLAWDDANIVAVSSAGAIPPLLKVVQSGTSRVPEGAKEAAASALAVLMQNAKNSERIVQEGGILPFVAMVKFGTATAKRNACSVLAACSSDTMYSIRIAKLGAIPSLVECLRLGGAGTAAALCLGNLARSSDASRLAIALEGAVPVLKEWLGSASKAAVENATFALAAIGHD